MTTGSQPQLQSTPTLRVVIVDDHPFIREAFEFWIGRLPATEVVATAADGQQALAACETRAPHVVILDYNMVGGKGNLAAAEIKRRFPKITIIGMSIAYSARKPMNDAGADYFFEKTEIMKELPEVLKTISVQMLPG